VKRFIPLGVRVKAVSNRGLDDSTWATVTAETGFENIFYALDGADITSSSVTLRWPAGREVTHFIINPGNVNRTITAGEITAGEATITELTSETQYMVTMYNGTKRKGEVTFETLIDIGGATPVYPTDDLLAKIAEASDGDVLALFPGEYGSIDAGLTIAFDKSITLKGVFPYDRPVIYGQITCGTTVTSIDVQSIIFVGTGYGQFFNVTSSSCNLGTLIINDCDISGYDNNILYNNNSGALGDITISNCYVHDIAGGGGDGLDFRSGTISSLTVENSTFANGLRTFLRMQAECNTVINSCTLYQVSIVDSGNNRGLFRSSGGGTIEVKNCIVYGIGIAGTTRGFWTRAGDMTATASYSNNYYFDSPVLFAVGSEYTDPAEVDATEADPGFADAANEDFTISNQTLLDNQVGDPRWRQ